MWLLNAHTLKLQLFHGDSVPPYAILSHRWRDDEVLYQDLIDLEKDPKVKCRAGYLKIRKICARALLDRLDWVWVDTCCIDKRSSAELSEAINSMFRWYWRAEKCYAYLDDVGQLTRRSVNWNSPQKLRRDFEDSGFMTSSWFTRGWTLQELIAPRDVAFYNKDWYLIGHRQDSDLSSRISMITGIDEVVLQQRNELRHMSVAKRMSWAAYRQTTRIEDKAYSLLGIFGVNMPMLYGEEDRAFVRLQQEIIRASTDQSILTWCAYEGASHIDEAPESNAAGILALSPMQFANCGNIFYQGNIAAHQSYDVTNAGLRMKLPMVKGSKVSWGILNCTSDGNLLGIQLEPVATPKLGKNANLVDPDTSAYTILPIRHGSHVRFMRPDEAEDAEWEDIIITAGAQPLQRSKRHYYWVNLRFLHKCAVDAEARYEVVEMLPSSLWDQSNTIQPADQKDLFAYPFRPDTDDAIGTIILEESTTKECLAIYFRYDADSRTTNSHAPFLVLSDTEMSDYGALTNELAVAEGGNDSPITSSLESQSGVKMTAILEYITDSNGDRELELRLLESSSYKKSMNSAWTSKMAQNWKLGANGLLDSVKEKASTAVDVVHQSDVYKRAQGWDALRLLDDSEDERD